MADHHVGPLRVPKEVTIDREIRAWELRQQFKSQAEIAAILGVAQSTVSTMLARVEARALDALTATVARIKARQTLQLEHLASEAYAGWLASKGPVVTAKRTESPDGVKVEQTTRSQAGNPSFLGETRGALADIRRIWGIGLDEGTPADASPIDPELAEAALGALLEAAEKRGIKGTPSIDLADH